MNQKLSVCLGVCVREGGLQKGVHDWDKAAACSAVSLVDDL